MLCTDAVSQYYLGISTVKTLQDRAHAQDVFERCVETETYQLYELGGFLARRVDPELSLERLGGEVEEQWVEARDGVENS